jgi:hypothetical protein
MVITENSVCVILDGKSHLVDQSHPNYILVREAVRDQRWSELEDLMDIPQAVLKYSKGHYEVTEDGVTYKGENVHGTIEKRLLAFMEEGVEFDYLLSFHERLQANPSSRAVNELYDFLEHKNIPIGVDGCFYAYKAVRADFKDIYSGKFDNSVGAVLEMPRNKVDDNCDRHCSYGFHVGSLEYVKIYGRADSVYLICKIDPADVVSVPRDHNCQKVRVSKYEVVEEYTGPLPETVWSPSVSENFDESWDGEEECDLCWGSGNIEEECYECDGSGHVDAIHPVGAVTDCWECDGVGLVDSTCPDCDGHGVY